MSNYHLIVSLEQCHGGPQEIKSFGNQLQQIKTNQMITRSFPRQPGESVWVPNPFQGMAFFGFLKLFACWGSKQKKTSNKNPMNQYVARFNSWRHSVMISNQVASFLKINLSNHSNPSVTNLHGDQSRHVTVFPCCKKNRTNAVSVNPPGTLLTPVFIRNISKACWLLSTKFCAPFTTLSKPSAWRTWRNDETTTPKVCYLPRVNPTINISYIDRLNSP